MPDDNSSGALSSPGVAGGGLTCSGESGRPEAATAPESVAGSGDPTSAVGGWNPSPDGNGTPLAGALVGAGDRFEKKKKNR